MLSTTLLSNSTPEKYQSIPQKVPNSALLASTNSTPGLSITKGKSLDNLDDDSLISFLCKQDKGLEWMLRKLKQNSSSIKEVVAYLKKRAVIEEEYGKNMLKLALSMADGVSDPELKQCGPPSISEGWSKLKEVTENLGSHRTKFAQDVSEVVDHLNKVMKDSERSRKQIKDSGLKQLKHLSDAEVNLEKSVAKQEALNLELEKFRLAQHLKSIEPSGSPPKKPSILANMFVKREKTEEDFWVKANQASETARMNAEIVKETKLEYHTKQLPYLVKSAKEAKDESDVALQALLMKFTTIWEDLILGDAFELSPESGESPKSIFARINHGKNLREYLAECSSEAMSASDAPKQVLEHAGLSENSVFGKSLESLCLHDDGDVPQIIRSCVETVEATGLKTSGLYRASASSVQLQKLTQQLCVAANPADVFAMTEWSRDPITVTNFLKTFLRELKEPLFTSALYDRFMAVADIEPPKLRLLKIHELINELPDPNYITLRYFAKHLVRVSQSPETKMTSYNLSVVFGPTLFVSSKTAPISSPTTAEAVKESKNQSAVIETMINGFDHIFDN